MSQSNRENIKGVLPVVHTPFDGQDRIDFGVLAAEVEFVLGHGADGVVMALASEILRLTFSERAEMTRRLVEYAAGRGVVVIGVHGESTAQALEYARLAEEAGADAVMATPPLTGSWNEESLFAHYAALAGAVALPVIVQDGSAHVGRAMPVTFQARLRNELGERILFKPEAPPVGPQLSALREATQGAARAFEGMAGVSLVDSYRRSVAGTMPGADVPDAIVAVWKALEAGDDERVYRIHPLLCSLMVLETATFDTLLALEKHILARRGVFSSEARRGPAAFTLDRETRAEADRLLERLLAAITE